MDEPAETVRLMAGLIAFAAFMYLIYLAGFEGYTFGPRRMAATIALIIIVMYGPRELEAIIRAARGGKKRD